METGVLDLYRECPTVVDSYCAELHESSSASAVIDAIAVAADIDSLEVPPLYEYVDPDLIDDLVDRNGPADGPGAIIGFQIEKWNVFVSDEGRILVCDATDSLPEPQPVFGSE